jgi:hypothetical protein
LNAYEQRFAAYPMTFIRIADCCGGTGKVSQCLDRRDPDGVRIKAKNQNQK